MPKNKVRASWHGVILAETTNPIRVEGNYYFPHDAIDWEHFEASSTTSRCPWKGKAAYYDVIVNGARNADAAWTYPHPTPLARKITDHIAFWNGVEVSEVAEDAAEERE